MKKIIYIFFIILSLAVFAACTTTTANPTGIEIDPTTIPENIEISEFDLESIKVIIKKDNDTQTTVKLTKEMISEEDYAKLSTVGTHEITINYLGFSTVLKVTINPDVKVFNVTSPFT